MALAIYGIALVATFTCSAGYHLIVRPKVKEIFRRLDHAAIFLMIAGTYTPFVLIKMNNAWGLGLLAVVWGMAAIGIAIKLFAPRFLDGLSTALYLVQGWAVLAAWEPLQIGAPRQRADPAHGRRRPLHGRRRVPSVEPAALSERDLARLRAVGGELPLCGGDRRRAALKAAKSPLIFDADCL